MVSVGDKLTVREDLRPGVKYEVLGDEHNTVEVIANMLQYRGKEATVTEVEHDGSFRIDLDYGCWWWTVEMFESNESNESKEE